MMRPKLYIFAKAPLMGRAKTRLAADIGPVHAKRLYRAMTAKVINHVQNSKWDTCLAVTPTSWLGRVSEWEGIPQIPQVEGSLTPRLNAVFAGKGSVVVIGTDSPQVNVHDINAAFHELRRNEAVLGPADDGGFWLIGLNAPISQAVFKNVRWSTNHALDDVAANISGSIHYLRMLTDVDDGAALKQVKI